MKLLYPILLVPILPVVPMDYRFNESYPFVCIGDVWSAEGAKKQLKGNKPKKTTTAKEREKEGERDGEREKQTQNFHVLHVTVTKQNKKNALEEPVQNFPARRGSLLAE